MLLFLFQCLVPFLFLLTNFIVQSFAKEWPRIVIHRSVMTCSSSTLYVLHLVGIQWAIASQQDRIDSDLMTFSTISLQMLVPGINTDQLLCFNEDTWARKRLCTPDLFIYFLTHMVTPSLIFNYFFTIDFFILNNTSDAVCAGRAAHIVVMIVLLHPSHL